MFHTISPSLHSPKVPSTARECGRRSPLWLVLAFVVLGSFGSLPVSGQAAPSATIPSFTSPIQKPATAEAFQSFIENHRGKLVHVNITIGLPFSKMGDQSNGPTDFFVSTEACGESTPAPDCDGAHYMISGGDYTLRYYAGNNILIGYFVVAEDVQMHQGRYYGLQSIPAAQVLLRK
jgi:hypothetical protein